MEKKKVQLIGFGFLIFTFIFAVTCISIAGVHFRYTSTTWTKFWLGNLGALELASLILVWFIVGIGAVALFTLNAGCLLFFSLLTFLSCAFTLTIVVFAFYGTISREWDHRYGCNHRYDGLWKAWESVDNYLQAADSILCSPRCPCYFNYTTTSLFTSSSIAMPYVNQWSRTDSRAGSAIRFQDCPAVAVADAYNQYLSKNAYYNYTFNPEWFQTYYRHVEEYFSCTGFCGTTYFDESKQTTQKIVKYLFSDIGRGIPEHIGCIPTLFHWVRKTLHAFGAVGCFMAFAEFSLFIIGLLLFCMARDGFDEESKQKRMSDELIEKSRKKELAAQKEREARAQKEREQEREKELANKRQENDEKNKIKQDEHKVRGNSKPHNEEIEIGVIDSSFIPSDAMKNENEFRFNPSVKQ